MAGIHFLALDPILLEQIITKVLFCLPSYVNPRLLLKATFVCSDHAGISTNLFKITRTFVFSYTAVILYYSKRRPHRGSIHIIIDLLETELSM